MGFEMKVTGLDEAQDQLAELIKNIGEDAVGQWFDKVAKTANEICKDAKVMFERGTGSGEIGALRVSDKHSAECVMKAFDNVIPEAPEPAKSMLTAAKADIKKQFELE
jgi:hypothetical protein